MTETRPNIFPALRYRNANAAIEWLKEALGFEEKAVYRGDDGTVQHAELKLGAGIVMLGEHRDDGLVPSDGKAATYVVVDDPQALYERARAAGVEVARELAEMDYGSREFSVRDPAGNLWSFGTYDPYAAG